MRKLRVLQVLEATAGGTRRHLRDLMLALSAEFELHLACAVRRDPEFAEDLAFYRRRGTPVHVLDLPRGPHPRLDAIAAWRLRRLIRREHYHLIHLHSGKAGLVGRLAGLGLEIPIIYSPHAFPFLEPSLLGRLAWCSERLLAGRTTVLHAVSRAEGRMAVEWGLADPGSVAVIENAVALPARASALDAIHRRRRAGEVVFGFLGELRPQKDPITFLRAAHEARSSGVQGRFVLPAQGPLLGRARSLTRALGLEGCVSFVPPGDALHHVYRQSDLGVLSSRWEGLPYALLDAMALRLPVVASNLPVFADMLGRLDADLLFPVGDFRRLARAFAYWAGVGSARLRDLGDAARRIVAQEHALEAWRLNISELYRQVAFDRRTHPVRERLVPRRSTLVGAQGIEP